MATKSIETVKMSRNIYRTGMSIEEGTANQIINELNEERVTTIEFLGAMSKEDKAITRIGALGDDYVVLLSTVEEPEVGLEPVSMIVPLEIGFEAVATSLIETGKIAKLHNDVITVKIQDGPLANNLRRALNHAQSVNVEE
ncbi:hypothetical protein HZS55_12145 [Halosimplex rubrum]|uniref:Uncharacterized protein n=1 Tax=Halosimplex rubrum TaxID=869889 RepID=A0A7D5P4E9_9EURY|nr:hypothetical protein [Halosimplex rubrum]QLH78004.1 hypothetical protein HZS55_12145 [Halosimplex rubrum]